MKTLLEKMKIRRVQKTIERRKKKPHRRREALAKVEEPQSKKKYPRKLVLKDKVKIIKASATIK